MCFGALALLVAASVGANAFADLGAAAAAMACLRENGLRMRGHARTRRLL
jgi:hypothetical protein